MKPLRRWHRTPESRGNGYRTREGSRRGTEWGQKRGTGSGEGTADVCQDDAEDSGRAVGKCQESGPRAQQVQGTGSQLEKDSSVSVFTT